MIEDWRTGYWDNWSDGKKYTFPKENISDKPTNYKSSLPLAVRMKIPRTLAIVAMMAKKKVENNEIRSHCYGMVGFVKELIDELGIDMITDPARNGIGPKRCPRFKKIEITPGQVFIIKATDKDDKLVLAPGHALNR